MGKKKRINPRRIPMPKSGFDKEKIINEASSGNLYFAWLLILHTMLEHEAKTPEEIQRLWNAANSTLIQQCISTWQLEKAKKLMGYGQPFPNLGFHEAHSEVEMAIYKRKAQQNALHIALASICLGLDATGQIDHAQLHRIFSNVDLTIAEIESGYNSYDQLAKSITARGLSVDETAEDVQLNATNDSSE